MSEVADTKTEVYRIRNSKHWGWRATQDRRDPNNPGAFKVLCFSAGRWKNEFEAHEALGFIREVFAVHVTGPLYAKIRDLTGKLAVAEHNRDAAREDRDRLLAQVDTLQDTLHGARERADRWKARAGKNMEWRDEATAELDAEKARAVTLGRRLQAAEARAGRQWFWDLCLMATGAGILWFCLLAF